MTTGRATLCLFCRHFDDETDDMLRCAAFRHGTPDAIIMSSVDHRQPVEGDGGTQFVEDPAQPLPPVYSEEPVAVRRAPAPISINVCARSIVS